MLISYWVVQAAWGGERRKKRTEIRKGLLYTQTGERLHFEGLSSVVKVDNVFTLYINT